MTTENLIFTEQTLKLILTVYDENNVVVDIADATLSLTVKRSGSTAVTVVPTLTGTVGELEHTLTTNDLLLPGTYRAQAIAIISGLTYPSSIITFEVASRL